MYSKFIDKRREAIKKYYPDGGSPKSEDIWKKDSEPDTDMIFGKIIEPSINSSVKAKFGKLHYPSSTPSKELSKELSDFIS